MIGFPAGEIRRDLTEKRKYVFSCILCIHLQSWPPECAVGDYSKEVELGGQQLDHQKSSY